MTKKKKSGSTTDNQPKYNAKELRIAILDLLKNAPKKRYNPRQIAQTLSISNTKDAILHALDLLVTEKEVLPLEDYKFQYNRNNQPEKQEKGEVGIVDMTRSGAAFIKVDGRPVDVYISMRNLNTAMNGDTVRIQTWTPRGKRRPEGEVIDVITRAKEAFLGVLYLNNKFGLVVTDTILPYDIKVELTEILGAENGDKVVVKITGWTGQSTPLPIGKITYVLGAAGSHDIEMQSILLNAGFDLGFSESSLNEAKAIDTSITSEEIALRRDMRDVLTFTIDPWNAKDFDDAISYRTLPQGLIEVGVHIADVTHYLREGSALDKEAYTRSTSVYLVDRVLPMLPEKLSNELCSLRPNEDKLTFSAIFNIDEKGKIMDRWFGRTIIHSDRRFTYEEAQEILDGSEGAFSDELLHLNKIAHQLRKRRFSAGAIQFESDEVQFKLDDSGTPLEIFIKDRKDAHKLIEDFMLLANQEVALFIQHKIDGTGYEIPFIYRVHDEPNEDKVFELARFAKEFGVKMRVDSPKEIAKSYNLLAEQSLHDPALKFLAPIAIRTMAKAIYSPENIGHYGLAFTHYTHFTSPIRRYSDVIAHRLLAHNLDSLWLCNKVYLKEQCRHISSMERKAMEAERESIKYKQVEFLEKHVGEVFEGIITGMMDRGVFVELLTTHCEGFLSFNRFAEPYEMDPSRLFARGIYTGQTLKMGAKLKVRLIDTNLQKRQVELGVFEETK
jgi:ribonuclease R